MVYILTKRFFVNFGKSRIFSLFLEHETIAIFAITTSVGQAYYATQQLQMKFGTYIIEVNNGLKRHSTKIMVIE